MVINPGGVSAPKAGGASFNKFDLPDVPGDGNWYPITFDIVQNGNGGLTPGDQFTMTDTGLMVASPCFVLFTLEGSFTTLNPATNCQIALFPQVTIDFLGTDALSVNDAVVGAQNASVPAIVEATVATPLTQAFFDSITVAGSPPITFPVELTILLSSNSGDADGEDSPIYVEVNGVQLA